MNNKCKSIGGLEVLNPLTDKIDGLVVSASEHNNLIESLQSQIAETAEKLKQERMNRDRLTKQNNEHVFNLREKDKELEALEPIKDAVFSHIDRLNDVCDSDTLEEIMATFGPDLNRSTRYYLENRPGGLDYHVGNYHRNMPDCIYAFCFLCAYYKELAHRVLWSRAGMDNFDWKDKMNEQYWALYWEKEQLQAKVKELQESGFVGSGDVLYSIKNGRGLLGGIFRTKEMALDRKEDLEMFGERHLLPFSIQELMPVERIKELEASSHDNSEIIEQAFMAGQCDCGVDPSWSSAQAYANKIREEIKGHDNGVSDDE